MYKALFTASSGMNAQQTYIDAIANNLANVNTNGFKASTVNFQDMLYETKTAPGTESAEGNQMPTGLEVGSGVRLVSTSKIFSQGELESSGGELDMAILGNGFFKVQMANGEYAYTRDGAFGLDGQRRILRSSGEVLADNITVPDGVRKITVTEDGKVFALSGAGTEQTEVGQIKVHVFANPPGLQSAGSNLFLQTVASGSATESSAGLDGVGTIRQGFIERANVDVVSELVHLITAQRAYEINTKVISISDKILQQSNNLIR